MMHTERLKLVGANHETASVAQREQLSLDPSRSADFYAGLKSLPHADEVFVLSTCNSLEIYVTSDRAGLEESVIEFLCQYNRIDREDFRSMQMLSSNAEAVQHLFEVAASIDSQIVGEAEILGQVKDAYALAKSQKAVGPIMNRVIQKSFQAAKWIRTHTAIGEGQISIATVAVDLAIKIFGRLTKTRVLVIGAGEIGEKTVRALRNRGAQSVTVTSRTKETAESLAISAGAEAAPIEIIDRALGTFDIIVSSTSSRDLVLTRVGIEAALKQRHRRPFFLIDLAVPRDIDHRAADLANVYLYNIDDLAEIANENLVQRKAEVARCRTILKERALRTWSAVCPSSR